MRLSTFRDVDLQSSTFDLMGWVVWASGQRFLPECVGRHGFLAQLLVVEDGELQLTGDNPGRA